MAVFGEEIFYGGFRWWICMTVFWWRFLVREFVRLMFRDP